MHNLNTEALQATIDAAQADPAAATQPVRFDGEWNTGEGPQFSTSFPLPNGETVSFTADFPPPMGGTGSAPGPLHYCFWGGLACYAMSFAQEAALRGIEIRSLKARVETEMDMTRALGVSETPPVEQIDWYLDVDADATPEQLAELKKGADDHCPGAYCIRNPIDLQTHLEG